MRWAWEPPHQMVVESNVYQFMKKHDIHSYRELLNRSIQDPAWFWRAMDEELGLEWQHPYRKILETGDGWAWSRWFIGGKFNFTVSCLDKHVRAGHGSRFAFMWEGEEGVVGHWTYEDLYRWTLKAARFFRDLGVLPGDRVGLYLPMIPEIVPAFLALARIGAVLIPIFSGYGPQAIATRLNDAEARFLITADGFYRRGKMIPMKETADAALEEAPSVERCVVVLRTRRPIPWNPTRDVRWNDYVEGLEPEEYFLETEPETPFMLIYTSGTTGKPKGTVHVHAGFPIKSAQDIQQLFDLKPDDTLFWLTDMGWMMGPWEVAGTLLLGGTFFLYDGAPDYPTPDRLWQMVERHKISILGISPTLIRSLMQAGESWVDRHPMDSLRILGSTGEPWNPAPWQWTLEHVGKSRCPIINYSGGTEVSGGIMGCVPILPLKPCCFHGPVPGMNADVVDEDGEPVRGRTGELIVKGPWPGMTRGFWRDPDRYIQTYFGDWPNVWRHGDLVYIDEDDYWYILGRSDDTLKIAGKRVGPAELESALVSHPAVTEAAVIGVPDAVKGEVPVAFVMLNPDVEPREDLKTELVEQVTAQLGKSFRPREIHFVPDLPRTRNAKIMRRAIRSRYLNEPPGDLSSLENPEALSRIPTRGEPGIE